MRCHAHQAFTETKIFFTQFDILIDKILSDSPVFKASPRDVIGDLGDKVSLECEVDSNPPASYQWLFDSEFSLAGPILNLELTNLTAGSYTCQAAVPGFPSISQTSRVKLRGPPRITVSQATQFR